MDASGHDPKLMDGVTSTCKIHTAESEDTRMHVLKIEYKVIISGLFCCSELVKRHIMHLMSRHPTSLVVQPTASAYNIKSLCVYL
eukprot:1157596-Pelagomonas_calceolata.AAC.3